MKVSVVIPCHNAAGYVGQTIGSLLEQKRPPDEIFIVLDRCTDNSVDVVRAFGKHVRFCGVDFGNASAARNFGATLCSGDALMFLDADDVLSPDALAGLEAALVDAPDAVALIPWKRLELVGERWVERPASTPRRRTGHDLLANWLTGHYYPPCCVLWSRSAYEHTGGWSEININQDGDLAMRAMILGLRFVMASSGYAYYRRVVLNSVSGQRRSRAGLSGRFQVIERLAAWLEERSRLHEYRRPLRMAFEEICRDCHAEGALELEAQGRALQRRYAAHSPMQRAADAMRAVQRRGEMRVRRLVRSRGAAVRKDSEVIVTFGCEAAATAERGDLRSTLNATEDATEALAVHAVPTVSVVIATYNRAQLVCRAVRSVLSQGDGDFEVLVVDDASTDDTESALKALGDSRIRYLRQPENRGVSAARNRGMREARGRYIAFLDSDDEWLNDKLEKQLRVMREAPQSVGLVYSGAITCFDDGNESVRLPVHRGNVLADILLRNITEAGSASVLIRRNVVRVVGFYDEDIPAMEDWDYWIRVARFYHFDFVNQPLVRYHEVLRDDRRSLLRENDMHARQQLFQKFRGELNHHGIADRFLLTSAQRRIMHFSRPDRLGALWLAARALALSPANPQSYRQIYRMFFYDTVVGSLVKRLLSLWRGAALKR